MTTNYNKKHHLQLLKQRSMGENSNEDELLRYSCILQNQLEWEIHDQYLELIEEFEDKLVEHFYKHSKKCFILDTCYTDWSKKNSFKPKIRNQLEFFSKQLFKKG